MDLQFQSINPHNGEVIKSYEFETEESLQDKIARCHKAYKEYRKVPVEERKSRANKLVEVIEKYK